MLCPGFKLKSGFAIGILTHDLEVISKKQSFKRDVRVYMQWDEVNPPENESLYQKLD